MLLGRLHHGVVRKGARDGVENCCTIRNLVGAFTGRAYIVMETNCDDRLPGDLAAAHMGRPATPPRPAIACLIHAWPPPQWHVRGARLPPHFPPSLTTTSDQAPLAPLCGGCWRRRGVTEGGQQGTRRRASPLARHALDCACRALGARGRARGGRGSRQSLASRLRAYENGARRGPAPTRRPAACLLLRRRQPPTPPPPPRAQRTEYAVQSHGALIIARRRRRRRVPVALLVFIHDREAAQLLGWAARSLRARAGGEAGV
jgi:hypothetical protein